MNELELLKKFYSKGICMWNPNTNYLVYFDHFGRILKYCYDEKVNKIKFNKWQELLNGNGPASKIGSETHNICHGFNVIDSNYIYGKDVDLETIDIKVPNELIYQYCIDGFEFTDSFWELVSKRYFQFLNNRNIFEQYTHPHIQRVCLNIFVCYLIDTNKCSIDEIKNYVTFAKKGDKDVSRKIQKVFDNDICKEDSSILEKLKISHKGKELKNGDVFLKAIMQNLNERSINDRSIELPIRSSITHKIHDFNQIIYGVPGTGKTYSTPEYAVAIIENKKYDDIHEEYKDKRNELLKKYNNYLEEGKIVFTTFHQNYSYEDFIQGIRPDLSTNDVKFKMCDGIFKKIVNKALYSDDNFVIIIDEINRGNISKIFGELITLIENDKRWGESEQMYANLPSGDILAIPNNLYIIGTMNSADKSISLIDAALRRRFRFIEKKPNPNLIIDSRLKKIYEKLNSKLLESLDNNIDQLIGHAYFMNKDYSCLETIFNQDIIPLLYEYYFGDNQSIYDAINTILDDNKDYEIDSNNKYGRLRITKKK